MTDTACPAREALLLALLYLHCTHWLSPGLPMPPYHSPINLSLPHALVSHIHSFNHSCFLLPCPKNSSKGLEVYFILSGQMTKSVLTPPFPEYCSPSSSNLSLPFPMSYSVFQYLPLAGYFPWLCCCLSSHAACLHCLLVHRQHSHPIRQSSCSQP